MQYQCECCGKQFNISDRRNPQVLLDGVEDLHGIRAFLCADCYNLDSAEIKRRVNQNRRARFEQRAHKGD